MPSESGFDEVSVAVTVRCQQAPSVNFIRAPWLPSASRAGAVPSETVPSGHRPLWVLGLVGKAGLLTRLDALFGGATAANWIFFVTLAIGFIHGWMKFKNTGALTTFAFDAPLTLALGLALLKQGSTSPWFPAGDQISNRLKALAGLAILYAIIPLGVPLLAALASFRAWVVVPLVYLLGYHITRSIRQVETVLMFILVLAVGVAVYGIRQSPEEIRQMMNSSPEMAMRLGGAFFASESGSGVRRFSTFVSPAAFGGTMASCGIFAFAFLTQPGLKLWRRLLFLGVLALCAYGIKLSGARTAIAMLGTGILLTAWARGKLIAYAVVPGAALAIVGSMGVLLDPIMAERFASLLNPAEVWGRIYIVLAPSLDIFLGFPLGGGLGRSGHGVPWIFRTILPYWEMRGTDGDFGRIIADFGIAGLVCFGALFYTSTAACLRWMHRFRGSPLHTVAICAGANFILAVLTVVTGSPFLGIPGGAVSWFMVGALSRLVALHASIQAQAPGDTAWNDPRLVPFGAAVTAESHAVVSTVAGQLPSAPDATPPPSKRRFLYAAADGLEPQSPPASARPRNLRASSQTRRLYGNKPE